MHEALTTYFTGEKYAGVALALIGLAMGISAIAFLRVGTQPRALAYTLCIWAVMELAFGIGLYLKTGPQVAQLTEQLQREPAAFYAAEQPRMATVQRNFAVFELSWLVAILLSAAVAVWQKSSPTTAGVALGLLLNFPILLTFDILGETRGARYVEALARPP